MFPGPVTLFGLFLSFSLKFCMTCGQLLSRKGAWERHFDASQPKVSFFHPHAWMMIWLDTAAAVSQNSKASAILAVFRLKPEAILMGDNSFKLIILCLVILCYHWYGDYIAFTFLCFLYYWKVYWEKSGHPEWILLFPLLFITYYFNFLLYLLNSLILSLTIIFVVYRHCVLGVSILFISSLFL